LTIALLSNVTVTSLAMRLNVISREEVYCPAAYNTWLQEISDPGSKLYKSEPAVVFILLHGRELFGETGCESREQAESVLSPLAETIAASSSRRKTAFVVSTLDIQVKKICPLASRRIEPYAAAFWRRIMEDHDIPLLDLSEIAADIGRKKFYNNRVWYMGAIPFSKMGEEALAAEMGRIWRAIRGERKKCLALDLDGALWGGAIGELGIDGIHLDSTGSGSRFRDFQKRILDLKNSGVLLAIISKNNIEDAMGGIRNHTAMLLKENDFAAIRSNWTSKADNLLSIASELNIGVDSFVFIDDSPVERESMRIALPDVSVPDFPSDSAQLEDFMIETAKEHFLQLRSTEEDLFRAEHYGAEAERREYRSAFGSVEEYLASLDMVLTVENIGSHSVSRAAQLSQKTNQFNLTTKRYTEPEMNAASEDPARRAYIGSLRDRFGNYGKIALCVAAVSGETASIEVFLMSCRVMGRDVESAFLSSVEQDLMETGVREINAEYVPTPKNSAVRDFWGNMGYERRGKSGSATLYRAKLAGVRERGAVEVVRKAEECQGF
jgi:FkbH-like protein